MWRMIREVVGVIFSWQILSVGFLTCGHGDLEQKPCRGEVCVVLAEVFWGAAVGWPVQGILGMEIVNGPRRRG